MADGDKTNTNDNQQQDQEARSKDASQQLGFETGIGSDRTTSVETQEEGSFKDSDNLGYSAEFDPVTGELLNGPDKEADGDAAATEEDAGDDETAEDDSHEEAGDEGAHEPLPEYDPQNEEVAAQYEARYIKDGKLNQETISKEFWAAFAKADAKDRKPFGHLPDGTYKFLEEVTGLDRQGINDVESALVAQAEARANSQYTEVIDKLPGGRSLYERALEWGRKGGYTKEQQERYNSARAKGGEDFSEAAELLVERYRRANPNDRGGNRDRHHKFGRKRSSPEKSSAGRQAGSEGNNTRQDSQQRQQPRQQQERQQEGRLTYEQYRAEWDKAYKEKTEALAADDRAKVMAAEGRLTELNKMRNTPGALIRTKPRNKRK